MRPATSIAGAGSNPSNNQATSSPQLQSPDRSNNQGFFASSPAKDGGLFDFEHYCEWQVVDQRGTTFTPRTGHAAISNDENIYVFGGASDEKRMNDLYEFNPWTHSWTQLEPTGKGPTARSGAKCAVFKKNIYYFGGFASKDGEYYNDLYMYNPHENKWQVLAYSGDPILARADHCMVQFGHSLYIFAGSDAKNKFNDLYKLSLDTLKCRKIKATGDIPTARIGHTGDVFNSSLYVFGGWNGFETLSELYNYSIVSNIWYEEKFVSGSKPPARYRHSTAVIGHSLFVFGGIDKKQTKYNDLHEFDFDRREWRYIEATGLIPTPRTFHQCVSFENKLYLFGGSDTKKVNDTYYISVKKNIAERLETNTEIGDVSHMMFFDPEDKAKSIEESTQSENQAAKIVKILTQQVEELKQRLKTEQERNVCAGCGEKEINAVFLNCGHRCMCYNCAVKFPQCPICKQRVIRVVKVFTV